MWVSLGGKEALKDDKCRKDAEAKTGRRSGREEENK
jgi:hypothetical protein